MNLRDMKQKKGQLVQEMRSLASGEMTADHEQRFDSLKQDVEGIEQRIARQEYLDGLEKAQEANQGEYGQELRQYSLTRAIAGQAGLPGVDHGREREVSDELARRSGRKPEGIFVPMEMEQRTGLISTTAPAAGPGGNLTSDDFRPSLFIDALRNALVIKKLGCTVLSGLTNKVVIPKAKASGTAYWVPENSAVTASDLQFEQVTLEPRTVGALSEISRQMLMQSSPDVEALVKNDFSQVLAQAVDLGAINGAGAGSNQPLGLFQMSGLNTVDVSAGWTWAKILGFIEEVEKDNSQGNAWLTRAEIVKSFRSTAKETAVYVAEAAAAPVSADYFMDGPGQLAGYPLHSTQNVPANQIAFGRWSDLILGMFGPLDLLVNPYITGSYEKGNVQVRMMLSCDVAIRHPESFCIATL